MSSGRRKCYYMFFFSEYLKIKVDSNDSLPLEKNIDFSSCYNAH